MRRALPTLLLVLLSMPLAGAEDGPRTGYFQQSITPLELLGEQGANAIASVIAADAKLTWQLSVPKNYDPQKPAGVMVFIGFADWGGGKKEWTRVLAERNLIWIGLIDGGDDKPVNERLLKAILAQPFLARDYSIDSERHYLFGYSGGAHVAAMLATSRPEMFKGAIYYGDALSWGKSLPPKIDLVRQNRYLFMAGAKDRDRLEMKRIEETYRAAGVLQTDWILVANLDRQMPGEMHFDRAIAFLDARPATEGNAE